MPALALLSLIVLSAAEPVPHRGLGDVRVTAVTVDSARSRTAAPTSPNARSTAWARDSAWRFPSVSGRSLDGREVHLPDDFAGEINVVLVAFARKQQQDVDSWTPYFKPLAAVMPGVRIYELPTLPRGLRMMRPMIDGGMRGGIPDPKLRETTITLYLDKEPFREALGIRDESAIHVFIVDGKGRILARVTGPYAPESFRVLEERIREVVVAERDLGR